MNDLTPRIFNKFPLNIKISLKNHLGIVKQGIDIRIMLVILI